MMELKSSFNYYATVSSAIGGAFFGAETGNTALFILGGLLGGAFGYWASSTATSSNENNLDEFSPD